MRVQAQHVFYLDFQLPEFRGTDTAQLAIKHNDQLAIIEPWDHTGELFEGELGQTLVTAQFLLAQAGRPGGQLARRVADITIDRLAVAIEWDRDGSPAGEEDLIHARLEEAVTYANYFISHVRAGTGSTHVNRIEVYWHPDDLTLAVQVPHTVQWFNMDSGTALPMFQGLNGHNSAGGIRLPFNGAVEWDSLLNSMSTGTLPPFHRTLLVDARDALTTAGIREAVLCIASACEVRITQYAEAQTTLSRTAIREMFRRDGGSFARRYFDLLPQAACGQSLLSHDAQAFADIQDCYLQRNGLMHEGDLLAPLKAMGLAERLRTVSQWRLSAERALTWVDSLPTTTS